MDDTAANIIDRETALANFDHARDDFESAFARVPNEALGYKPEGDDYSLGDLIPHVIGSIDMYSAILNMMGEVGYGEVRPGDENMSKPQDYDAEMQVIYAGGGGGGVARTVLMDKLDAAHDRLASMLRELAYEDFSRPSPVYYPGSTESYPTRASDIIGWLTDHYNEHIAQVAQLLEAWKRET